MLSLLRAARYWRALYSCDQLMAVVSSFFLHNDDGIPARGHGFGQAPLPGSFVEHVARTIVLSSVVGTWMQYENPYLHYLSEAFLGEGDRKSGEIFGRGV